MRYTTLDSLKDWLRDKTSYLDSDDASLTLAILRAEEAIDCFCGSRFEAQTLVLQQPRTCWIDGNGWLNCQMHYPLTAVTAVEVMDIVNGATDWTSATIKQVFVAALEDSPAMRNYRFRAYLSSPTMGPRATGDIAVQVSYAAGYSTIPGSLQGMSNRLSHFYYLQRDAPASKTVSAELGTMEIPLDMPPDIARALMSWRNLSA